jgi:hypothetical protein
MGIGVVLYVLCVWELVPVLLGLDAAHAAGGH